jgi:(2Fe-2S) ferredoxin
MPPFERHVFICTNRRPDGDPKGCCAAKGAEEVRERFKQELRDRGMKGRMRANAAGCLDTCALGVSVVVYPEGIWYARVRPEDVTQIIDEHLIGGKPVERLLMRPPKK